MHTPHGHHHPQAFGAEHASHYDASAEAGLAGYHAMLDLTAAAMAVSLKGRDAASVLCVGVGTGQELLPYARYGAPAWRFTGVDPSPHMVAIARERLAGAGLAARVQLEAGALEDLPASPPFAGAQMLGVLHHVEEAARLPLLREVVRRLEPGAPFVLAGHVGTDPVLEAVEDERRRVAGGATPEQLAQRRTQHARLAVPASDEALFALLREAGLVEPRQLFATLRFKAFLLRSAR